MDEKGVTILVRIVLPYNMSLFLFLLDITVRRYTFFSLYMT